MTKVLATLCFALTTAACSSLTPRAAPPSLACEAGDQRLVRDTLYFGRNRPSGGTVSEDEWQAFLADVVTPRFPDGLTVANASGQWRGVSGAVETEVTQVVTLLHPGDAPSLRKVDQIAGAYRQRFAQEAVMRERTHACVAFVRE